MGTITPALIQVLDRFAASQGLPTVRAVLNRSGASKPEIGKVIPLNTQSRLYWIEKD